MKEKINKIAVTGTKGKTTVVNLVAQILQRYDFDRVLHVDTTGHFVNGERKSTLDDSKRTWGLVPSVAPGRYLYELLDRKDNERVAAVLETSLGCSTLSGMGYAMHHVGVFLNIFEDHIGSSDRISSKEDILEAKKFVIKRILRDGFVVLNADDELLMTVVDEVPTHRDVYPIFFGKDLTAEVLPEGHQGAAFITLRDENLVHVYEGVETVIVSSKDLVWAFDGAYEPSLYNAMAIAGAVIGLFGGVIPENLGLYMAEARLDPYGGRLTRLENDNGVTVIADYAHEKKSLVEIGALAKKLTADGGKVIGVVRLAYDRTDELIADTGRTIAPAFDHLVVYDKIDGHWRQPKQNLQFNRFTQEVGKVSQVFADAIMEVHQNCDRILREDHALAKAAEIAAPGDVVVAIVNDDIEQSIRFIKEQFNADFA